MDYLKGLMQKTQAVCHPVGESVSEVQIESDSDGEMEDLGRRCNDVQLRQGAIGTPVSEVDWNCTQSCTEGRECAHRPGFLPFVVDLRRRFWGKPGSPAPSSKERRDSIDQELRKGHHGGKAFIFGYKTTLAEREKFVRICETAYFKALGCGKTGQWYRAMDALKNGKGFVNGKGRPAFKSSKVKAFIDLFLWQCDMPPSKHMQEIKILPFPSTKHFYDEYCSSYRAPYLAIMSQEEALR